MLIMNLEIHPVLRDVRPFDGGIYIYVRTFYDRITNAFFNPNKLYDYHIVWGNVIRGLSDLRKRCLFGLFT